MQQSEWHVISIDLEKINNGLHPTWIGVCVINGKGVTVFKKEYAIRFNEKDVDGTLEDPASTKSFWANNNDVYKEMIDKGKGEEYQIKEFVKDWDMLEKKYPLLVLASDNPECDFGLLSYLCKHHANRDPVRFTTSGKYRSIRDLGEAMYYLGIENIVEKCASEIQIHDHRPDNDAENTVIKHLLLSRFESMFKDSFGEAIYKLARQKIPSIKNDIIEARSKYNKLEE